MNAKLVLLVLILYVIAFKFVYFFLVTSLDLWNDSQEKLADRKWLFAVVLLSQQRYSSSL